MNKSDAIQLEMIKTVDFLRTAAPRIRGAAISARKVDMDLSRKINVLYKELFNLIAEAEDIRYSI